MEHRLSKGFGWSAIHWEEIAVREGSCPICGRAAEAGHAGDKDSYRIRCPRCGPFEISGTAAAMLPSRLDGDPLAVARASHAVRTSTSDASWLKIDSTTVDGLVAHALPAPNSQLSTLIEWLKAKAGERQFAGQDVSDRDAISAIVGAADEDGLSNLLELAAARGLLRLSDDKDAVTLTGEAWTEDTQPMTTGEPASPAAQEVKTFGICPTCGPDRRADIVATHTEHVDHEPEGLVWSRYDFNILRCRGCEIVYVQKQHFFSEDEDYDYDPISGEPITTIDPRTTYWPTPRSRERPSWTDRIKDEPLQNLLEEVYEAVDAGQRVLAAIGTRTAIDRAMVLNGAEQTAPFAEKIRSLYDAGSISATESDALLTLTDAGSAAAHRGWRPTFEMLSTIMDGMEAFMYRTLVLQETIDGIRRDVPAKPKRKRIDRSDGSD